MYITTFADSYVQINYSLLLSLSLQKNQDKLNELLYNFLPTDEMFISSVNPNVSGVGQKSTTPSNYQHRIFLFNYTIVRIR